MGQMGTSARTTTLGLGLKVEIAGSWNDPWKPWPCKLSAEGLWVIELNLEPGTYEYKYLINGIWFLDSSKPTAKDLNGHVNNILTVTAEKEPEEKEIDAKEGEDLASEAQQEGDNATTPREGDYVKSCYEALDSKAVQCANQTFVHTVKEQVASPTPRAGKNKSEKNSAKKSHSRRRKSKEEEFFDCCTDPDQEKTDKDEISVGSDQGRLSEANSEETEDSVNKSGNTQTQECDERTRRNSPDMEDLKDEIYHSCPEWILVGMATPNNSFDEIEEASEIKHGPSSVFYTAKAVTDETEVPQLSAIDGLLSENTEIPLCPSVSQTDKDDESVSGEEPLRAENESKSQGATTVSKENEERAPDEMEHQEEESAETREETSAPSFDEIFTEKQSLLMGIEQETESQEGQETNEPKDDSVNLLSKEEELNIDTKPDIDEQKSGHNSSTT